MQRLWIILASLAGFSAVAMAAFAAHGIGDPTALRIVSSGVQMQGWHALALLGVALWTPSGGRLAHAAGAAFAIGLILFCGATYSLGLAHLSWGILAPTGGILLMLGWLPARRLRPARPMIRAAYLAAADLESPLSEELTRRDVTITAWHGRLALSSDPPVHAAWALETWTNPQEIPVPSVKSAADALRGIQRNWAAYSAEHYRRMALIAERLPPVKARPLIFPEPAPVSHLGAWTLLTQDRMLASPTKSSPFINGECHFIEDHIGPPSRAYLKLWEALTRFRRWPKPGETCLDLGASPGGWTWVLASLNAQVTAIDKAPLEPKVAAMQGVTERLESAFAVTPEPVDWLCSDIIAYPDRLLALVKRWIDAKAARHIVCTIKFQGPTDHDAAEAFAAIAGGQVIHLYHNKHELTFLWSAC